MEPVVAKGQGFSSLVLSHPGCKRGNNEDSVLQDEKLRLWAVADGMGGHDRGEVASQLAIETLREQIIAGDSVADATQKANLAICQQGAKRANNMGTTLVAMRQAEEGGVAVIAWVGDSRIYRLRTGEFKCLSTDHTLVNELVAGGVLSAEDALKHPDRHRLTRALGGGQCQFELDVDVLEESFEPLDIYLLCSDGLSGVLEHEVIRETLLRGGSDIERTAKDLLQQVLDAGAPDNVSMVIVHVDGPTGAA